MPGNWHENSGYGIYHTQCPCLTTGGGGDCPSGFSGGGLDDRFDFWLSSYSLRDGEGLDLLLGLNYITYGQDGQHYNMAVNGGGFNNAVGITVANALHDAADHLPVIATLQLPALSSAPGPIAFGSAIVGATAEQLLPVQNVAAAPADELTYSLAAPAGFSVPAGPFTANAGITNNHVVTMDTGTSGTRGGDLVLSSDDPENPSRNVALTGVVLDHAEPSLDSLAAVLGSFLDFGEHDAGEFEDQAVKVFNLGYDALQARLQLTTADIAGGAGRFSIVGGFTPTLVGATPAPFAVRFDDQGAATDSAYTATLTFASADEALPGASARPDLVVSLEATVTSGATDVVIGPLPTLTRLLPVKPNPARGQAELAFDLAREAPVSLRVYDLNGRCVSELARGPLEPGRYRYAWQGLDDQGNRVPAGVYFARFVGGGVATTSRLVFLR
jgi:hypothetical protein